MIMEEYNLNTDCVISKIDPDAKLPTRATEESAGLDFYALEDTVIGKGKILKVRTGVACKPPNGTVGVMKDRSSLAAPPNGLHILAGVIDSDYTGEIMIVFKNLSVADIELPKHSKIGQMVIVQALKPKLVEVKEMPKTVRGTGGFGSSNTESDKVNVKS